MFTAIEKSAATDFATFLQLYGARHLAQPTRLGVFVPGREAFVDYWMEDGLPLAGIAVEPGAETNVEIMLGRPGDERHLTHTVKDVRAVKLELQSDATKTVLELVDGEGRVTVLRFEESA